MRIICCLYTLLMAVPVVTHAQYVQEQVYVHTDRNYYQAGEIMWFSIYDVDADTHKGSTVSHIAYVELLDSMNKPLLQAKIKLDSGRGNGSMMIPAFANSGVYTFRCYTNWMKNFGAQSFFTTQVAIVNAGTGAMAYASNSSQPVNFSGLKLTVAPGSKSYDKRDKVTIQISVKDSLSTLLPADVSVTAYRLDSLIRPDFTSIAEIDKKVSDENIFNTHVGQIDPFPYPPEINSHFITGYIINRTTRMRSANIPGYLSVIDDGNSFYNGISDEKGNIKFLITKLNAADSIVVQTNSSYHPEYQVEINNPFFEQYAPAESHTFIATDKCQKTVLAQSINAQANALYYEEQVNTFNPHKSDTTPFYYSANARYILDDYIRFSKLEDVLREYVRPVGVARRQNRIHLSVFNQSSRYLSDAEPLVLVDGVPVFDFNTLFAYDPLKVKTIDVVTDRYYKSGSMFPGIIDLTTYRRRSDGELIDENASVLPYEIIQKERKFYSPSYASSSNTHLPDFRETVYWNPSVHVSASGDTQITFYTPDIPGEYFISVQGLSQGKPSAGNAVITVK